MGMTDAEVEEIRLGAVLHDVGKVGIPESILNKNGPLNPGRKWETMKSAREFMARKSSSPLTPLAPHPRNGSASPRILRRLGLIHRP